MVRTASNSYFPQVVSAVSIPDPGQELPAFRTIDKVRVALEKYNEASVLVVIDELKGDGARVQEPRQGELFFARRFVPDGGLSSKLTRGSRAGGLHPHRAAHARPPENANIGLVTSWLPATEIRGEGVFIQLDDRAVAQWELRPAVLAREEALASGYAS
jgi:hypothetical protein